MTQNQASLRWKKPGFEQKFLMQGEKQVPAASGCRKFYGDSNINFHLYAYAGNSPVRYTDPDGRIVTNSGDIYMQSSTSLLGNSETETISNYGCTLTSYTRMAIALGANVTLDDANSLAIEKKLYVKNNLLTIENGVALVNALLKANGITDVTIAYDSSANGETNGYNTYIQKENSENEFFCNARISTSNSDGTSYYDHTVSIDSNALLSDRCDCAPTNMRIRDTSNVGRNQLRGGSTNRVNNLQRLDFFKINRITSQIVEEN